MNTYNSMNFSEFFYKLSQQCVKAQKKEFKKGDIITSYIAKRRQLFILINGEADLIRYDLNGNRTIVEHYSKNNLFGEIFYNVTTNNELFVEAQKKCEVIFFNYDYLENKCELNCKYHNEILQTLPHLFLNKLNSLNTRIEILTKRTIRDKLLTYFNIISSSYMSKSFTLPFSLTDLADYLSVDRSAMMREISLLKKDNIIDKIGNKITLLYK